MSIALVTKRFLSKALDFKNEGNKNKWVTDLITELESTVDATNSAATLINTGASAGPYTTITSITVKNGIITKITGS